MANPRLVLPWSVAIFAPHQSSPGKGPASCPPPPRIAHDLGGVARPQRLSVAAFGRGTGSAILDWNDGHGLTPMIEPILIVGIAIACTAWYMQHIWRRRRARKRALRYPTGLEVLAARYA